MERTWSGPLSWVIFCLCQFHHGLRARCDSSPCPRVEDAGVTFPIGVTELIPVCLTVPPFDRIIYICILFIKPTKQHFSFKPLVRYKPGKDGGEIQTISQIIISSFCICPPRCSLSPRPPPGRDVTLSHSHLLVSVSLSKRYVRRAMSQAWRGASPSLLCCQCAPPGPARTICWCLTLPTSRRLSCHSYVGGREGRVAVAEVQCNIIEYAPSLSASAFLVNLCWDHTTHTVIFTYVPPLPSPAWPRDYSLVKAIIVRQYSRRQR